MKRFSTLVLLVAGLLSSISFPSVKAQDNRSHLAFYPVLYPDRTIDLLVQTDRKLAKQLKEQHPLLRYLNIQSEGQSADCAEVAFPTLDANDTTAVNRLLALAQEKKYVKNGLQLAVGPDATDPTLCAVYALEMSDRNAIPQAYVTEVTKRKGLSGNPEILVTMTEETASQFAQLTRVHLLKHVAICCAGQIFSVPRVVMPVDGKACAISTVNEAEQERLYRLLGFH